MKKMIQAICFFLLITADLLFSAYAGDRPFNELPMYGGQHDPQVESDLEASKGAGKLGWEYYYKGDLKTAIKRFNQAWMFNRNNVDALWGFGLIMARRSEEERPEYHLRESIRFFEMALSIQENNSNIIVDLAYSYTGLGDFLNKNNKPASKDAFSRARMLYEKADKLGPQLPPLHLNWSVLEFCEGNYSKARERLDNAKRLGYKPGSPYEKELEEKLKN
jgi:tetratricopeptide (TPR) repeat protein